MADWIRIVVLRGDDEVLNERYQGEELSIGKREVGNDVVLNAQGVSRKHATIRRSSEGLLLSDMQSTNGTFVNDERVDEALLAGGEKITIGPFVLHVSDETSIPETRVVDEIPHQNNWVFEELEEELIDREPSERVSIDELAPIEIPEVLGVTESQVSSERSPSTQCTLASIYREAALSCGAPGWGRPSHEPDNETLAVIRIRLRETDLSADEQGEWYHRLGRELAGEGPLPSLLAEASFDQLTVCGIEPIEVRCGHSIERLPLRYSCHEAVCAEIYRLLGSLPPHGTFASCELGAYQVSVIGEGLVDGPGIVVQRMDRESDLEGTELFWGEALPYIGGLVCQGQNILMYGRTGADLKLAMKAIMGRIPEHASITIVQRGGTYRDPRCIRVDGYGEPAQTWGAVAQLNRAWLILEEVNLCDIRPLFTHGRHAGGGTIVTTRAPTGAAALARMEAFTTCAGFVAEHVELAVRQLFDAVVHVQLDPDGMARVSSIQEVHSSGELVEIFTNDEGQLRPTGVESVLVQ